MSVVNTKHIPTREEIPAEFKWHLSDIYVSQAEWETDFQNLKKEVAKLSEVQSEAGYAIHTEEGLAAGGEATGCHGWLAASGSDSRQRLQDGVPLACRSPRAHWQRANGARSISPHRLPPQAAEYSVHLRDAHRPARR